MGFFDDSLLANEDYEFNTRIRKAQGRIWLDPKIRAVYLAQPTLRGLFRQYWRYGYWKWKMLRRYPESLRWRQGLPPLFLISIPGLILLGFIHTIFWILLGLELSLYGFVLTLVGFFRALKFKTPSLSIGFPLAAITMHFAWGAGFLFSMIDQRKI